MTKSNTWLRRRKRRGAAAVLTLVGSTVLIGFAALAIDVGMLNASRAELQRTADAAAMAGAMKLLDPDRLKGTPAVEDEIQAARQEAQLVAGLNAVHNASPALNFADIVVGYLSNPNDLREHIAVNDPNLANTVQVRARRDSLANGPINLWFAQVFGFRTANLTASAAATIKDGVIGYRVTSQTGNADILPLALQIDAWRALLAGLGTVSDRYTYNPVTKTVSPGGDGTPEIILYPGAGTSSLPSGNFGTVNIGPSNNSTQHLSYQIRHGVTAEDLAYFGGELKFGPDGTLLLNGDTGLSAGIKDDLESIKGLPRSIPLFRSVAGPGNNAMFTVVGFGGVRIMNVKLTGNPKQVVIQPAFVIDDSVITASGSGPSYFVYEPVRLVR